MNCFRVPLKYLYRFMRFTKLIAWIPPGQICVLAQSFWATGRKMILGILVIWWSVDRTSWRFSGKMPRFPFCPKMRFEDLGIARNFSKTPRFQRPSDVGRQLLTRPRCHDRWPCPDVSYLHIDMSWLRWLAVRNCPSGWWPDDMEPSCATRRWSTQVHFPETKPIETLQRMAFRRVRRIDHWWFTFVETIQRSCWRLPNMWSIRWMQWI